jgi:hypothetical protein
VSSVCDLPIGPGKQFLPRDGLSGKALRGWHSSGVQAIHTGNPLTETLDGYSSSLLDGSSHPDHRPTLLVRARTCSMRWTDP